jgi:hypothetical protein
MHILVLLFPKVLRHMSASTHAISLLNTKCHEILGNAVYGIRNICHRQAASCMPRIVH